jgi:hypothetical protein
LAGVGSGGEVPGAAVLGNRPQAARGWYDMNFIENIFMAANPAKMILL